MALNENGNDHGGIFRFPTGRFYKNRFPKIITIRPNLQEIFQNLEFLNFKIYFILDNTLKDGNNFFGIYFACIVVST